VVGDVLNMNSAGNKRIVLIVACLSSFLTPFMGSSINIALPSIGHEFAMDAIMLNWVATSYILASAMFLLPFGRGADIYGRKRIFLIGIAIFSVTSLLAALSTNVCMLITVRILQGLGSAMIFATGVAILTSVFPLGERGKALGISVASVYLGLSLGPFLGGALTEHFGWRSIFLVTVPVGIFVLYLTARRIEGEWAESRGEKLDLTGSAIYSITLVGLMYGFSRLPSSTGILMIIFGILGFGGFLLWETRVRNPLIDLGLFQKEKTFAFSNLAALIHYSATFAIVFLLSLCLQYLKGMSAQQAGLVLVVQPLVMAVFSPVAGMLSDRIEPRIVASLGMSITACGIFLLIFLNESSRIPYIMSCLIIIGFGFALFSSPNTNAIMSSVEKKFYGVASGVLATMRLVGQMMSMGIAMMLFAIYIGRVQISPQNYDSLLTSTRTAFIIFVILCFFGIFASLARGSMHNRTSDN